MAAREKADAEFLTVEGDRYEAAGASVSANLTLAIQFRVRRARRTSSLSSLKDAAARLRSEDGTPSKALTLATA
jgi:hypothetical protein